MRVALDPLSLTGLAWAHSHACMHSRAKAGAQPSKRRSGGGHAPDPDALSEAELWQGIVRALQAARRKLGALAPLPPAFSAAEPTVLRFSVLGAVYGCRL